MLSTPRHCKRCDLYYLAIACPRCLARSYEAVNRKRQFEAQRTPIVYQSAKDAPPPDPRPS